MAKRLFSDTPYRIKIAGLAQGLIPGRMTPLASMSSKCLFISFRSSMEVRYERTFIGAESPVSNIKGADQLYLNSRFFKGKTSQYLRDKLIIADFWFCAMSLLKSIVSQSNSSLFRFSYWLDGSWVRKYYSIAARSSASSQEFLVRSTTTTVTPADKVCDVFKKLVLGTFTLRSYTEGRA